MSRYAKECGVSYMTFDNQMELHKIAEYHPKAKYVKLIIIKVVMMSLLF